MCHGMQSLCTVTAGDSRQSIVESGRNYTVYVEYRWCVKDEKVHACVKVVVASHFSGWSSAISLLCVFLCVCIVT